MEGKNEINRYTCLYKSILYIKFVYNFDVIFTNYFTIRYSFIAFIVFSATSLQLKFEKILGGYRSTHISVYTLFISYDFSCTIVLLFPSPMPIQPSDIYQFRDKGYAVVPSLSRFSPRRFFVSLRFKTFWKDQLLFFTANNETVSQYDCGHNTC